MIILKLLNELLKNGFAYKCYCTHEEIEEQKKRAKQKKLPYKYNRKCRDLKESDAPKNSDPVIRFKSKSEGNSILKDLSSRKHWNWECYNRRFCYIKKR